MVGKKTTTMPLVVSRGQIYLIQKMAFYIMAVSLCYAMYFIITLILCLCPVSYKFSYTVDLRSSLSKP